MPIAIIIANAQNLGFTKGNNRVIEMILKDYPDVEYIALLNNDTKVELEWLSNLVKSAKTNEADVVRDDTSISCLKSVQ